MENKKELKTTSAKKYLIDKYAKYEFPFKVLDDTSGGSNLGRIEVCIELFRSKRKEIKDITLKKFGFGSGRQEIKDTVKKYLKYLVLPKVLVGVMGH